MHRDRPKVSFYRKINEDQSQESIQEQDNDQTNLLNPSPGETPTKEIENRRVPGLRMIEV